MAEGHRLPIDISAGHTGRPINIICLKLVSGLHNRRLSCNAVVAACIPHKLVSDLQGSDGDSKFRNVGPEKVSNIIVSLDLATEVEQGSLARVPGKVPQQGSLVGS